MREAWVPGTRQARVMAECVVCGGDDFDLLDGLFFCSECGTQSQVCWFVCSHVCMVMEMIGTCTDTQLILVLSQRLGESLFPI